MLPTVTLASFPPSKMLPTVKNQYIGKKMLPTVKLGCFQPSKMLPMVYGKKIRNAEDEFAREIIGEEKAKFRLNFKLIFIIQQNAKLPVSN